MLHPFGFVYVPSDEPVFENLTRVMKPRSHTIVDNPPFALRLKQNVSPETMYYLRQWGPDGDENDWRQESPEAHVQRRKLDTYGGVLGLQLLNEPGFGPDVIGWLNAAMKEAVRLAIPVSIGGFAPSTIPDSVEGWKAHPAYEEFAYLICHNPGVVLDEHERYSILWTQGLQPKTPVETYSPTYFIRHLAKGSQWPRSADELAAMYMVGRIKAFFDFCRQKWPDKTPRVRIGEFGPDDMPDSSRDQSYEQWLKSQPSSNPIIGYPRGWRSCFEVWKQLYFPGEEPEMVNYAQGRAAWERILEPLGVESVNWYVFGNGGEGLPDPSRNWDDHNYAKSTRALEIFMTTPIGSTPTAPAPGTYTLTVPSGLNLREQAGDTQPILTTLKTGARVTVLPLPTRRVGAYDWFAAESGGLSGWCAVLATTEWTRVTDPTPSLLTVEERDVLNTLAAAWNKFLLLPTLHPDHQQEYRTLIHHAQRIILARPVVRLEPSHE